MRLPAFARLLALSLFAAGLAGCGGQQPARVEPQDTGPVTPGTLKPPPPSEVRPGGPDAGTVKGDGASPDGLIKFLDLPADKVPQPTRDERYDAALLEALGKMADRNYPDALAALEKARDVQDTEQVRLEIEQVRKLINEQKAAEQTRRDVQAVLDDGKADEAAKLAAAGLQQYGGGDGAEKLAQLKRQADALAAAQIDDGAARRARFAREGDDAVRDKNLRAAVIAYEQALQAGDDPALRSRLDEVRVTVSRYDEQRQRALDLRRDPANLEQALAALQEAAKAWDTPQVRQDIDECTLALQKRRDRVSVADFEVRGDVGIPMAGRTVAETLLPAFRPRFDLVEREQLGKVLDELRLEAGDVAASDEARQQVGRLARVRYVVVGSITPLCGITVNARLVEVRTGLVVQTAKLIATDPDDLMRRLPKLALLLQMTDEQKIAFEADLAQAAAAEVRAAVIAPVPPPPPLPEPGVVVVAPPPIIVFTPRPAPVGGLVIADFDRLPPPPPPERAGFSFDLFIAKENPVKGRLLSVSLELGDNLFRRGRYREAQHHFELAFSLSRGHEEISVRLERCRQLAPPPPPPPVVVVVPPVVVVRPRIAIFNFVIDAPPGLVPVGCDNWAADQLAGCYAAQYEVIDRGEVCWWMGRLGITMRDVLFDPMARAALAQSLNARFFVFGSMTHTASFDVSAHMVDAQTGAKTGGGFIHVQDHNEMKLRMQELVGQATGTPAQAKQLAQDGRDSEKAVSDARKLLQAGKYAEASAAAKAGLQKYPNNVALQSLQAQADQQLEKARLEAARREEAARQAAQAEAARKQQQELAKQAEAARLRAQQEAKNRDEATKRAQETQKQRAFDNLIAQAHAATQAGHPQQAVSFYDSALALKSDPAAVRERDQAKASAAQAAKAKADAEKAQQEAEARKQHEAALAAARAKVEAEKKQREVEQLQKQRDQEARDAAELARLIDQAKGFLAKGEYDAAMGAVQTARRLKKSDEVEKLAAQVQQARAQADAEKKGQQAKADLEKKLAADKAARDKAEAEAKLKQQQYQAALAEAQKAQGEKRYDQAIAKYEEAGKLFRTDAVLAGIKQAQDAKARDAAAAKEQQQAEKVRQLVAAGRAATAKGQYDAAAKSLGEANALAPKDATVQQALHELAQAKDHAAAEADKAKRQGEYAKAIQAGRDAYAARRLDDAVKAFGDALRIMPGDRDATAYLQQATKARDDMKAVADAEARRKADYTRLMNQGQTAMAGKHYADAVKAYGDALRVVPNDPTATKALKDAQAALDASKAPPAPPPGPPAEYTRQMDAAAALEKQQKYADAVTAYRAALRAAPNDPKATKGAEFAQNMADGQKALAARKFPDAVRDFEAALKVMPGNADATALLKRAKEGKP
jgi:tetratricopeptide (TPR) repeat protein